MNGFPWRVALPTAAGWLLIVAAIEWRNPRLVPAWHGFLHAAIATRFPSPTLVPENPFFAGEPLPYYWVYHAMGAGLARLIGLGELAALQLMAFASLAILVTFAVDLGRRLVGSPAAGVLIGCLALVGANPLGPLIAGSHAVLRHDDLVSARGPATPGTAFVDDAQADAMMSRPLLGALYFGTDWRSGQNLVWFWDISSRGPALAALMWMLWLLARGARPLALMASGLVVTALSPVIGVPVTPIVCAWLVIVWIGLGRTSTGTRWTSAVAAGGALAAGTLLAVPTFSHLFHYAGAASISPPGSMLLKTTYLTLNFGALAALALWSSLYAPTERRPLMRAVTGAGITLLGSAVLLGLTEGNEHNLANAAAVLLAVPAGLAPWYGLRGLPVTERRSRSVALIVALACLPMTAATLTAFDGRPALPFSYVTNLERLPAEKPVARLEAWIRRTTPGDAVLVMDPDRPVKMSGNASELPAFTGRTLFVDQANYLTRPYRTFMARTRVARTMIRGEALRDAADRDLLLALDRPILVISTDVLRRAALEERYGPPVFVADFVSVFAFTR
jgi:hypothetical protein